MKHSEWLDSWKKIKERFPKWNPTQTEAEDFCRGLIVYKEETVEDIGQWIVKKYSSKIPRLAWYIRGCERRKRQAIHMKAPHRGFESLDVDEHEAQKEKILQRLEGVPKDDLRNAYQSVMEKHGHLISKPEDGNVREWKQTLRLLIHHELFGEKQ